MPRLALVLAIAAVPMAAASVALYRRSTRPTEAPDAISAGWAYLVQRQVESRDKETAEFVTNYNRWVEGL